MGLFITSHNMAAAGLATFRPIKAKCHVATMLITDTELNRNEETDTEVGGGGELEPISLDLKVGRTTKRVKNMVSSF
jgi:hypothetical protein